MPNPGILIADDEPNIRETLAFILEMEGFDVTAVSDGAQALEAIRRLRPPVVLLDAMMPRMDGFAVCRGIRAVPELSGVTIVMLSALGQKTDRARALAAGADHYVTKPYDEDELLALLRRLTGAGA
jgi:DNA-binding response OmpR family regulator